MLAVDKPHIEKFQEWYNRRDRTMAAHLAAEAAHDVDAIMTTYAPDAELVFNSQVFDTSEQIRNLHLALGFGGEGAISNLASPPLRIFYAGEAIVIEYCITGTHQGEFAGIQPTGQEVAMAATVIYEFDEEASVASLLN
jgi:SnoaL-like domain